MAKNLGFAQIEPGEDAKSIVNEHNADTQATLRANDLSSFDDLGVGEAFILVEPDSERTSKQSREEIRAISQEVPGPASMAIERIEGKRSETERQQGKLTEELTKIANRTNSDKAFKDFVGESDPDESMEKLFEGESESPDKKTEEEPTDAKDVEGERLSRDPEAFEESKERAPTGFDRMFEVDDRELTQPEKDLKEYMKAKANEQDEKAERIAEEKMDQSPKEAMSMMFGGGEGQDVVEADTDLPTEEGDTTKEGDERDRADFMDDDFQPGDTAREDQTGEETQGTDGEQAGVEPEKPEIIDPSTMQQSIIEASKNDVIDFSPSELEINNANAPDMVEAQEDIVSSDSEGEANKKGKETFGNFTDAISAFLSPKTFQAMRQIELKRRRLDQSERELDQNERQMRLTALKEQRDKQSEDFDQTMDIIDKYQETVKDKTIDSTAEAAKLATEVIKGTTGVNQLSDGQKQLRKRLVSMTPEKTKQQSGVKRLNQILKNTRENLQLTDGSSESRRGIINTARSEMIQAGKRMGLSDELVSQQIKSLTGLIDDSYREGFKRLNKEISSFLQAGDERGEATLKDAERLVNEIKNLSKRERKELIENRNVDNVSQLRSQIMTKPTPEAVNQNFSSNRNDVEAAIEMIETDMVGQIREWFNQGNVIPGLSEDVSRSEMVGTYFQRVPAATFLSTANGSMDEKIQAVMAAEKARLKVNTKVKPESSVEIPWVDLYEEDATKKGMKSQSTRMYVNSHIMQDSFEKNLNSGKNAVVNMASALADIRRKIGTDSKSFDKLILKQHIMNNIGKSEGFGFINYDQQQTGKIAGKLASKFHEIDPNNPITSANRIVENVKGQF